VAKHTGKSIAIIASIALATSVGQAAEILATKQTSHWKLQDSLWEAAYLVTHIADWGQTRDIAMNCGDGSYVEMNPLIGSCPRMARVNGYFLATALLHVGASAMLPARYRRFFQTSTMVMELGYITNNYNIGLRVNF